MEKSGNRPRECPGTPQQARASPICPAGRILFSNENGKLCAAALEMNFVPHHHLAPSMWHPPSIDSISEDALLKNFYRWRENIRKRKKRREYKKKLKNG